MEKQINKMYAQDVATIGFFLIFMWLVLGFVLNSLVAVVHGIYTEISVIAAGMGVAAFATLTLLAVISHLKHHKTELYTEDITNCQI